jgi:hypothetical protein
MSIIVFVVLITLFIMFLFGLFVIAERQPGSGNPTRSQKRSKRDPQLTPAATEAMRNAGYAGTPDYVQVTDIGLLAYRHSDEPKLVRSGDVMVDTRYLRPFVELWLPYAVSGSVRFELIDSNNRLRYADEEDYDLEHGKNTLLPDTWLPLEGKTVTPGDWALHVLAEDRLLAAHTFGWDPVGGGPIQEYVDSDGEISQELQQLLTTKSRHTVSLSDLLSDQEDWT